MAQPAYTPKRRAEASIYSFVENLGKFRTDNIATLLGAADLSELVAVMGLLEPGLAGWLLVHPVGGRQAVMMVGRQQGPIDPIAAGQISRLQYPGNSEPVSRQEPWANALLDLLGYQFEVKAELLTPIWSAGSLLAIAGISRIGSSASSLARGMVLAVQRLHQIDSLKRDVEGHRFLLARSSKSILLAKVTGRILAGTEGGLIALKQFQTHATHHEDALILPAMLRRGIETENAHVIQDDLQATFSRPTLFPGISTAEPLVAIAFSGKAAYQATPTALSKLTAAERRVHDLILRGDRNKEIGAKLGVSTHTIRHHVSAILGKLGFPDRVLLIAAAARQPEIKEASKPTILNLGKLPAIKALPEPKRQVVGKRELTEDTA